MYCVYQIMNIADVSDEEMEGCRRMMSESKRQRVERMRFEVDRRRTVAGELLARRMIASRCGVAPSDIIFRLAEKGKPYAEGLPVEFSLSHSGELVLCAMSDRPVGADVEKIHEVRDRLISYVCTDEERCFVTADGVSCEEKMRRFYRVWTGKEAYYKYLGTGITVPLDVNTFDSEIRRRMTFFYFGEYAVSIFCDCECMMKEIQAFGE